MCNTGLFSFLSSDRLVYIFKIYFTKWYLLQMMFNQKKSNTKDRRVFFIEVDTV